MNKTVSIGYYREDGDFAILATLNNNDGLLSDQRFKQLIELVESEYVEKLYYTHDIMVLERQDTPDYVEVDAVTRNSVVA
jgi:hypothetical protein